MMIVWGSQLYGKVDVVPEFFHVETRFGHLWYIPLVPVGSFVVLEKDGANFRGVKIPLSYRSILMAWLRTASLIVGAFGLLMAVALAGDGHWQIPAAVTALGFGSFALLKRHRWATRASYDRACRLGEIVGLTPEGRARLDAIYGYKDGVLDPFAGLETAR